MIIQHSFGLEMLYVVEKIYLLIEFRKYLKSIELQGEMKCDLEI